MCVCVVEQGKEEKVDPPLSILSLFVALSLTVIKPYPRPPPLRTPHGFETLQVPEASEAERHRHLTEDSYSHYHSQMLSSSPVELSRNVKLGTIRAPTNSEYVAVCSESNDTSACIRWTVLEVIKDLETSNRSGNLVVNPKEFGLKYLKPGTRLLWRSVDPPLLTKVILAARPEAFKFLEQSQVSLRQSLPSFVKSNTYLESLECYVLACEPADQGIVPKTPQDLENFAVSVIDAGYTAYNPNSNYLTAKSEEDIDVDSFLYSNSGSLSLEVRSLKAQIPFSSIMPPPSVDVDPENLAFVKMPIIAKLGVFSGDLVVLKTDDGHSRLVNLYSYPESNEAACSIVNGDNEVEDDENDENDGVIYCSPLLKYNLGEPINVEVGPAPRSTPFEFAKEIVLSRVSSPDSTDKSNQSAFLKGLKGYFSHPRTRVVKNNDLIPVPINSSHAKLLGFNSTSGSNTNAEDEPDIDFLSLSDPINFDIMIWFQVNALPTDDQYLVDSSHTRIVQSGVVQVLAPPAKLNWQGYWGLPQFFNYLQDPNLFGYAQILYKYLRASIILTRGAELKSTILLKSSKRGAGKTTLVKSVCAELGLHTMILDANDLIGDSDSKTLGLLRARLERAAATVPCVVCIKHLESLAKKNDLDGKDTPLINGIIDILDELLSGINGNGGGGSGGGGTLGNTEMNENLILVSTVSDPDALSESVRNKFKFEVDVTVPTENERHAILDYLTSAKSGFNDLGQLIPRLSPGVFTGFQLRGDVSISKLALQTAGLGPPDLQAIIRKAKHNACACLNENVVICSGGHIRISPEIIEKAVADAREKFSDSIGAPKIPNVTWKDVGGLDLVKGEILDTIEMPLKYPELFANGLKKRSGILFYGPPGTGKTLLAKAIATNFSLNFFSVKGPELLNMYIGESEANVRRVFQKARDAKPCVVFFDELDSVAPKRGNKGDSGGVMDRIVSQLLAELDGMSTGGDGVFVVGATNRPDLLDEALLRPGRFDKMLYLGVSDTHDKQRTILEALTRKFELDPTVDLHKVAEGCPFTYTGADFYAMSSDAMLNAMTRTAGEIDSKIAKYNASNPDNQVSIRRWFESIATAEDVKVRVSSEDFAKAQRELVPSVSADELQHYLRVRQTFEGSS